MPSEKEFFTAIFLILFTNCFVLCILGYNSPVSIVFSFPVFFLHYTLLAHKVQTKTLN